MEEFGFLFVNEQILFPLHITFFLSFQQQMSAGGVLTQLIATGAQDTYLIGGDGNSSCMNGCNIGNTFQQTSQSIQSTQSTQPGQKMYVCNQMTLQCEEQNASMRSANDNVFLSLKSCQEFCK